MANSSAKHLAIYDDDGSVLTLNERDALKRNELAISRGISHWREVGSALCEIRDGRLYREKFSTFEAYLAEKWGVSRREGYRLIEAAAAANNVAAAKPYTPTPSRGIDQHGRDAGLDSATADALALTRNVARALADYSPEMQRRVWKRLTGDETAPPASQTPTVKEIRHAASIIAVEDAQRHMATLPPRDRPKRAEADKKAAAEEAAAAAEAKKEKKERREKDRAKLVRWAEKLSALVGRMECGGWDALDGMAVKVLAVENEIKIRLAGRG